MPLELVPLALRTHDARLQLRVPTDIMPAHLPLMLDEAHRSKDGSLGFFKGEGYAFVQGLWIGWLAYHR
jgi:hypothetical protein